MLLAAVFLAERFGRTDEVFESYWEGQESREKEITGKESGCR